MTGQKLSVFINPYIFAQRIRMSIAASGSFSPKVIKVRTKWVFFMAEFETAAKIREIAVYRFLIPFLVPKL